MRISLLWTVGRVVNFLKSSLIGDREVGDQNMIRESKGAVLCSSEE